MGFGSIGGGELMVIFLVILLLFGGKKLPELARGVGKGINEFKKATREVQSEMRNIERQIQEEARVQEERKALEAHKTLESPKLQEEQNS